MAAKGKKLNKKILYIIVFVIISICSALGYNVFDDAPADDNSQPAFQVHYIDVGQGDSSLVICDGKTLLIDAGENGHEADVINYLRNLGIQKLDYIIVTHQHSDHIGGMPEVIEEFDADNIIMPKLTKSQTPTNSTYKAFLEALKGSDAKVISSKVGASYSLGSAKFDICGPVTDDAEDINSMSVVTKITYGETSFLFTGDAETDEEKEVLDIGADVDADVYKMGHHGSYTSSSKDFLNAVTPEICIISCGTDNDYGHPHDAALKRAKKHTSEIYRTDICGSIVVESNGVDLNVSYENQ